MSRRGQLRRSLPQTVAFLAAVCVTIVAGPPSVQAAACWWPPVAGPVVDPFREPDCPYCAGNRGSEYRVGRSSPVRAVATGRVTWSGSVAGVRYVVVGHADGIRVTYGNLDSAAVRTGDRVAAGSIVGRASGSFHFGVRSGERYLDPARFVGRVTFRPRLVPIDATPARPAPPVLRCDDTAPRAVVLRRGPR